MKQTERFLPIGTVVTLKNGSRKVMIYTYGIYPTDKVYSKEKKYQEKKKCMNMVVVYIRKVWLIQA